MLSDYVDFFMDPNLADCFWKLKEEVDALLQKKLEDPSLDILKEGKYLMLAVQELVSGDQCEGRFVFGRESRRAKKVSDTERFTKDGTNPKSLLQTLLMRAGHAPPKYKTKHLKTNEFRSLVEFKGMQFVGKAKRNKQLSERDAAIEALAWLTHTEDNKDGDNMSQPDVTDNMLKLLGVSVSILLAISTWVSMVEGLKKPSGVARKEDIPYIKCQVCEKLASELYNHVQKKQAEISPKKISEYQIIEMAENVCNLKKEEADWILKIDIIEQGKKLKLVDQDVEGQCNSECKTIERACQDVVGYSDTDLAEYLYKRKPQLEDLVNYLCKDLTDSCTKKPPPVPKDRTPGEPFIAKPTKESEMEKMMRSMEGLPGAPGMKMYSREDLMNMNNLGGEEADDDDDDDDDDNFPSNLGKVIRDKETKKTDWKEEVTKQIEGAGKTLKRHANKVSNKVRQWWRAKKAAASKKKASSSKSEL